MKTKLLSVLGIVLLGLRVIEAAPIDFAKNAAPFAIAWKIQERPEMLDLGLIGKMAEAILQEAEEIDEISVDVGDPPVALNVVIFKPKDYGFKVRGTTEKDKSGKQTANFSINISSQKLGKEDFAKLLSPEKRKEFEENGNLSFEPGSEEGLKMIGLNAREGGAEVEAKSKTIFLLNGYSIPNRAALPWALVLAKQGYQVITLDLPGFGKSGGKGPAFGKREPEDLMELLSQLQSSGKIGEKEAVGVLGVSYGGGMASLWAARDPRVKATVLVAPYAKADETIVSAGEAFKAQLNLPFPIDPELARKGTELAATMLGVDWEEVSPAKAIPTIGHPIHFVTSPSDKIIPASVVKELHQSAMEGSTLGMVNVPHVLLGLYLEELEPDVLDYFERTLR